jgi:polysaccharide biosynthesis/export protein
MRRLASSSLPIVMPDLSMAPVCPAGNTMCAALKTLLQLRALTRCCATLLLAAGWLVFLRGPLAAVAQTGNGLEQTGQSGTGGEGDRNGASRTSPTLRTSEDWNRRLGQLANGVTITVDPDPGKYRIGPDDVLDINVFAASELNRVVRVSSNGDISLPLLGCVRAAGLTPVELESHLQDLLRRSYMRDPHVSVFLRDLQSHPVSVLGAVKTPGVFQVRGPKTLLEVLSFAGGLSDDAGDTAIILRGATWVPQLDRERSTIPGDKPYPSAAVTSVSSDNAHLDPDAHSPETAIQVKLKDLLDSADPHDNPLVYPGDIVKVSRAGVVYVVGDVKKPGGFTLKSSEKLSVLQAIALSEGLTPTAAKSNARVIRTDPVTGERKEFGINLNKIMKGKDQDIVLEAKDIVFVPNSAARTTFSRGAEAAAQTLTGLLIFHW